MPAVIYPSILPAPQPGWAAVLRERAVRSSMHGNPQARRRSTDAIVDVSAAQWTYTPEQMAVWWPWFHTDLIDGQRWFLMAAPGSGGFIDRTMRFRPGSMKLQPLGRGIARVVAELEVRGRSLAPQVA